VELFGQLAPGRDRRQNLQVDSACTAGEVAKLLSLDTRLIGLVTIDGVQKKLEDPVTAGSRLCFFPPMSGG
jgi:molybdopterin converting factor small subunit